jgi:hypothetical protein
MHVAAIRRPHQYRPTPAMRKLRGSSSANSRTVLAPLFPRAGARSHRDLTFETGRTTARSYPPDLSAIAAAIALQIPDDDEARCRGIVEAGKV